MSSNPIDDLPDDLREAFKEMMEKLQSIDPEKLDAMMNQLFGEDLAEKLREMSVSPKAFPFQFDPNLAKNIESMLNNLMHNKQPSTNFTDELNKKEEEEPYYEISPLTNGEGEIVVDLPGIEDLRMVMWERNDNNLHLTAENDEVLYKVIIPIKPNYKLKDIFAELKNSVFILPYKSD